MTINTIVIGTLAILWMSMIVIHANAQGGYIPAQGAGVAALQGSTGPTSNTGPAINSHAFSQVKPFSGGQVVEPFQFQAATNTLGGQNAYAAYSTNAPYFYTDAAQYSQKLKAPPLDIVRTGTGTYETTHAVQSPTYAGYTLGFQNKQSAFEYRNLHGTGIPGVKGLGGYATNPHASNVFFDYNVNNAIKLPNCNVGPNVCMRTPGCKLDGMTCVIDNSVLISGQNAHTLLYKVPPPPDFMAKLSFTAKGKANKIFTDIDTRTRIGGMEELEDKAVEYFKNVFGLDFENYRTFGGAQMIPFKLSDDIFLQVTDSLLPTTNSIIPERNRVLLDGFMVKPMYGETVVLGGEYAKILGDTSVFMKEDETLMYYEYRIIDEIGNLYQTFEFLVPYPLKINNKGITGWFACVFSEEWDAFGREYGVSQIVNYSDHEGFTFNNLIFFDKTKHGIHEDDESETLFTEIWKAIIRAMRARAERTRKNRIAKARL